MKRFTKKTLSLLLTLCMVLSLFAICAVPSFASLDDHKNVVVNPFQADAMISVNSPETVNLDPSLQSYQQGAGYPVEFTGTASTIDYGCVYFMRGYVSVTDNGNYTMSGFAWADSGTGNAVNWISSDNDGAIKITNCFVKTSTTATAYLTVPAPNRSRQFKFETVASASFNGVTAEARATQYVTITTTCSHKNGDYSYTGNGNGTHKKYCPFCGYSVTESCSGLSTSNGTCSVCKGSSAYAVTLDNQGATKPGTGSVTGVYGQSLPAITAPQKTGYQFTGYYTAISGGAQYYTAAGTSARSWDKTQMTTLFAQWAPNTDTLYTVEHYYMGTDGMYPTEPEITTGVGTTGNMVVHANVKQNRAHYIYNGEKSGTSSQIKGDGSTVIKLYYDLDKVPVNFYDGDQNLIQTVMPYYGAQPVYTAGIPATPGNEGYSYIFQGWTTTPQEPNSISSASVYTAATLPVAEVYDTNYYAYFEAQRNYYTVTFHESDTKAVTRSVAYGDRPVLGYTPMKSAAGHYTYSFSGWNTAQDGSGAFHPRSGRLPEVTGNTEYWAVFSENPMSYLVSASAGTGVTLNAPTGARPFGSEQTFTVQPQSAYNKTAPTVTVNDVVQANPEPDEDGVYTYTFTVDGPTNIAVADLPVNTYTVRFEDYDGAELQTLTGVAHGSVPSYTVGANPTRPADQYYAYAFTGWKDTAGNFISAATKDVTYVAQYKISANHDHNFSMPNYDATYHWMECECGERGYEEFHAFTTTTGIATPADCVTNRVETRKCACGATNEVTVPNSKDTSVHQGPITLRNAYEPTCALPGSTGEKYCEACGAVTEAATMIPATGNHVFSNHTETATATCLAGGYETWQCATCSATIRRNETPIDRTTLSAHVGPIEDVFDLPATCVDLGRTGAKRCAACGTYTEEGETTPATGVHTFVKLIDRIPATCNEKGYNVYQCLYCDATQNVEATEGFNADNHAGPFEVVGAVPATCIASGSSGDVVCTACGVTTATATQTAPTGVHTYTVQLRTVAPTCASKGYDVYKCANCDATTNTNYSANFDPENHEGPFAAQPDTPPTCETAGRTGIYKCTACGKISNEGTVLQPTGEHDFVVFVETVPATCVTRGYDVYRCKNCTVTTRKNLTENLDSSNHIGDTVTENAVTATGKEDGYSGDVYCAACHALLEAGHTIPATGEGVCKWCGEVHTGPFVVVTSFFHDVLFFIAHLFGLR